MDLESNCEQANLPDSDRLHLEAFRGSCKEIGMLMSKRASLKMRLVILFSRY